MEPEQTYNLKRDSFPSIRSSTRPPYGAGVMLKMTIKAGRLGSSASHESVRLSMRAC